VDEAIFRIEDQNEVVSKFWEYCIVDERLERRVAKDYKNVARRFLSLVNGVISRDMIRAYLTSYLGKAPKTYNNQLDGLRAFVSRFLERPDLMEGFKKAHQSQNYEVKLPTKEQLRKGFNALSSDLEKAIYLFYASTGLRREEVLQLRSEDIDLTLRLVKSRHDTRTKKGGITFYNDECEVYLRKIFNRTKERVFNITYRDFVRIWRKVSEAASFRITPQVLRVWFSTEMGEVGVPDRYVDVFQGRAPKTVLAKFYTGKELQRLKRIYDKAELRVLS